MPDDLLDDEPSTGVRLDPGAQLAATQLLILEGQRESLPVAKAAMAAAAARDQSVADRNAAIAEWLRSRWGGPATAAALILVALGLVSRLGGVHVDLADLVGTYLAECPPALAMPSSTSVAPEPGPKDGPH